MRSHNTFLDEFIYTAPSDAVIFHQPHTNNCDLKATICCKSNEGILVDNVIQTFDSHLLCYLPTTILCLPSFQTQPKDLDKEGQRQGWWVVAFLFEPCGSAESSVVDQSTDSVPWLTLCLDLPNHLSPQPWPHTAGQHNTLQMSEDTQRMRRSVRPEMHFIRKCHIFQ